MLKKKLLSDRSKAVLPPCKYSWLLLERKSLRSYQNDIFGFFLSLFFDKNVFQKVSFFLSICSIL
jgi:hypothetical protein